MDNTDTTQAADAPVDANAQPSLSVNDLQNLRAIVDTAVRRGAFQAAEASFVGSAFDRLNAFLNAVAPQQPAQADGTTAPVAAPAAAV